MRFFETSPLELLVQPLRLFKVVRESWTEGSRQCYIYEHVYTGLLIVIFSMLLGSYAPISILLGVLFHIVVKEFIYDKHKHGYVNVANVIERVYGFILGGVLLLGLELVWQC